MFVTAHLQGFIQKFLCMCFMYVHTKFHTSSYERSFVTAIQPKAKYGLHKRTISFTFHKKYLDKSCLFLKLLLLYGITGAQSTWH